MKQRNIEVGKLNEPLMKFRGTQRLPDGTVAPLDITDIDFRMVVKNAAGDVTAIATYTTTDGISKPDPVNGELAVQITTVATQDPGSFFYHLDTMVGDQPTTQLYGEWLVRDI